METYSKFDNTKIASRLVAFVYIYRITLVNERGERVLDTLIKVDDSMIAVKSGLRTQLKNLAKVKGPAIEKVRQKVLELIKGRTVIGYHIYLKLNDFGIWSNMINEDFENVNRPIDCSVMFNKSISEPQQ